MNNAQQDLILLVNGTDYSGWYEQSFSRSMEDLCGKFSLSVFHDSRNVQAAFRKIQQGDKCEVLLAGHTLMTGWVDSSNPFYSRTDIGRKIEGRDMAADVVDSSARHGSGEWHNATFDRIARDLCEPKGVKVVLAAGVDVGKPFSIFRLETGEKIGEVLARAASYRGLRIYSLGDGTLMIARVNKEFFPDSYISRSNRIISAERVGGEQELYHTYRMEGQGNPNDFGTGSTSLAGVAYDVAVRKTRELIIPADTSEEAGGYKKKADCTAKQRRARAAHYVYVMDDWLRENGKPWEVNMRVDVDDDQLDLSMAEMVISGIDYKCNRKEGKTNTLTIKLPSAFDETEMPEPKE